VERPALERGGEGGFAVNRLRILAAAIAVALSIASPAYSLIVDPERTAVSIDRVDAVVESLGADFSGQKQDSYTYLVFSIYVSLKSATFDDIDGVTVFTKSKESHWNVDFKKYWDAGKRMIGGYGIRYSDAVYSLDGGVDPLTGYTVEIRLKDGSLVSKAFDIPPPNGKSPPGGALYAVDDRYDGIKSSGFVPVIARPVVSSARIAGDRLELEFVINDDRVANVFVSLYDADKKVIGSSQFAYRTNNWAPAPELNEGRGLLIDGGSNRWVIPLGAFGGDPASTLARARTLTIFSLDGRQFVGGPKQGAYNYLSCSARAQIDGSGR
jgi:hypothetical protein